jgi:hypothetical protein
MAYDADAAIELELERLREFKAATLSRAIVWQSASDQDEIAASILRR